MAHTKSVSLAGITRRCCSKTSGVHNTLDPIITVLLSAPVPACNKPECAHHHLSFKAWHSLMMHFTGRAIPCCTQVTAATCSAPTRACTPSHQQASSRWAGTSGPASPAHPQWEQSARYRRATTPAPCPRLLRQCCHLRHSFVSRPALRTQLGSCRWRTQQADDWIVLFCQPKASWHGSVDDMSSHTSWCTPDSRAPLITRP